MKKSKKIKTPRMKACPFCKKRRSKDGGVCATCQSVMLENHSELAVK